jgi:hypothetical protein
MKSEFEAASEAAVLKARQEEMNTKQKPARRTTKKILLLAGALASLTLLVTGWYYLGRTILRATASPEELALADKERGILHQMIDVIAQGDATIDRLTRMIDATPCTAGIPSQAEADRLNREANTALSEILAFQSKANALKNQLNQIESDPAQSELLDEANGLYPDIGALRDQVLTAARQTKAKALTMQERAKNCELAMVDRVVLGGGLQ